MTPSKSCDELEKEKGDATLESHFVGYEEV